MHTRRASARLILALTLSHCVASSTDAQAFGYYSDDLPSAVPQGEKCVTCHIDPAGRGTRNDFGDDVAYYFNGGPYWPSLFALDSDRDGYTNGQELGDPAGTWSPGDPFRTYVSAPGDELSTPCGNDRVDAKEVGSEACDGADLGGKTCADFGGMAQQALSCTSACELDTSACVGVNPSEDASPDMMRDESPDLSLEDEPADVGDAPDDSPDLSGEDTQPDTPPSQDASRDASELDAPADLITLPTPAAQDSEGCSHASAHGPTPAQMMWIGLGMLGVLGLRRRRVRA